MIRALDVASSLAASVIRLGNGLTANSIGPRPAKLLELYDFEACPYCRKVREALTAIDLDAIVYPCPRGERRFRARVKKLGGREQFPYLVDPNTKMALYESDAIVRYLYATYGAGDPPMWTRLAPANLLSSYLASAYRLGAGRAAEGARKHPQQLLELWSFEASPYCRLVREALCGLELPYILHNVGKQSPRREALVRRSGKMMVPYLADPNTGQEMFESADIVAYLYDTYGKHRPRRL